MKKTWVVALLLVGVVRASAAGTGSAGVVDRERVLAAEREQERIAAMSTTVAGLILDLLKTMRANRAADAETIARWEHAVRELSALSQQNMTRVVTALRRARAGQEEEALALLRTASLEQREILSRLQALLRTIEKRVAFARLVEQVEQLIKDQARVKEQTVQTARQALGKAPEQLTDPERERLDDLKDEQDAVRETYDRVRETMESAFGGEPSAEMSREAAAVGRAVEQMRADRPDRDMREAVAGLAERNPVSAAEAQKGALEKLRRLRDILRHDDSAHLQRLDAAAAELDRLIKRQREAKRQTSQLKPDAPAENFQDVVKVQNPITHATGELAKVTEGAAPRAADALKQAVAAQQQAENQLAVRQPSAAEERQGQALDRMREAEAALKARRDEVAKRLEEEGPVKRLEQAAADLNRLINDQDRALAGTQRMADQAAQGNPASSLELNRAAEEQRALAQRTQELGRDLPRQPSGAPAAPKADATRTLNAALKHQEAAAGHLDRERADQAAPEQNQALSELRQAAASLRYQLQLARQAQAQAEARAEVLARQEEIIDDLGEVAKRQRDLDELLAEQRALRAATGDLAAQMGPDPERQPLTPARARQEAGALATRQRDLEEETLRLADRMAELDRDVAQTLDAATGRQIEAVRHLERTRPVPAAAEQDRAVASLEAARTHLAKKLNEIVALLKGLEARRRDLARAQGQEEPAEAEARRAGRGDVSIDDLLKLASALVDIDRLRTRQQDTREQTAAEAERAAKANAKPNPATVARLTRQEKGHADDAQELGQRMGDWDPERAWGVEDVRSAVRTAGDTMHRATARLNQQEVQPAVTDQTEALKHLDVAMAAAVQAFQRAAQGALRLAQVRRQQSARDPREYDPHARPPGALGPEDLARVRHWHVNLPRRLRDEIIAALGDPFPVGFEILLQRYYEDLSQEAWEQLDLRPRPEK